VRACPRCQKTTVTDDGYCGICRMQTLPPMPGVLNPFQELQARIGALNWKLSSHIDAGGGIVALERQVDALMQDNKNNIKLLLAAGLLPK
jgi:hypothetical protein